MLFPVLVITTRGLIHGYHHKFSFYARQPFLKSKRVSKFRKNYNITCHSFTFCTRAPRELSSSQRLNPRRSHIDVCNATLPSAPFTPLLVTGLNVPALILFHSPIMSLLHFWGTDQSWSDSIH